jgi:hypothetical protein
MCTEKCVKLSRRGALAGGAAVAVSAAMGGTAQAGERKRERGPAFRAAGTGWSTSPTR